MGYLLSSASTTACWTYPKFSATTKKKNCHGCCNFLNRELAAYTSATNQPSPPLPQQQRLVAAHPHRSSALRRRGRSSEAPRLPSRLGRRSPANRIWPRSSHDPAGRPVLGVGGSQCDVRGPMLIRGPWVYVSIVYVFQYFAHSSLV
jgi:hypothetical protein